MSEETDNRKPEAERRLAPVSLLGDWQEMATAPFEGMILGREKYIHHWGKYHAVYRWRQRVTWWGKVSHVPFYGWCHGRVENVDLWQPTQWKPLKAKSPNDKMRHGANKLKP